MGVRKLQTYMEKHTGDEGFKKVIIEDLKKEYEKEHSNAPIELLVDMECCIRYIFSSNEYDYRYGGDLVSFISVLRTFFEKFNRLGIKVIVFFGNYTPDKKRNEWLRRRIGDIDGVNKLFEILNKNEYENYEDKGKIVFLPPSISYTAASIIKFILNERVILSLTDNDIEIIKYGRQNNSFAILSQDSDFIIADAAKFYLSAQHFDIDTMTTRQYNSKFLAQQQKLKLNQLALYASLLGTDLMPYDALYAFHRRVSPEGRYNLKSFFSKIAFYCHSIHCNENGMPSESSLVRIIRDIRAQRCPYTFEELYTCFIKSIQSYHLYQVEPELCVRKVTDGSTKNLLRMALALYRQNWIPNLFLLITFARTMDMSTSMEIFHPNVKPIGYVLQKLRNILYGVIFVGEFRVVIREFVVTGPGCFDPIVPEVTPPILHNVQPLLDVWHSSLEIDTNCHEIYADCYDENVIADKVTYRTIAANKNKQKEYFIGIFQQACFMKKEIVQILLQQFQNGLLECASTPLFAFLYLEQDQYAYLHQTERDAILFTFVITSVLTSEQVLNFKHPLLKNKGNSEGLVRATSMFFRTCILVILLNAACGFPIEVPWLGMQNCWHGTFVQLFYEFLFVQRNSVNNLIQVLTNAITMFNCSKTNLRFKHLVEILVKLELINQNIKVNVG